MTKRTYQPHRKSKKTTHGFLVKMSSKGGRRVIKNRRKKGRGKLAP